MVDLHRQYLKLKDEINESVQSVIDSSAFINGSAVKELQQSLAEYIGVKHAVTCGNGTDALTIALMALDLNPGDEVITTDFTFIASVEAIALLNLKPVLADVNLRTFIPDAETIEKAITPRTRVILPVHLFGQSADSDKICELAKQHNLYVIEDAAQCIGAEYKTTSGETKKLGSFGDIACTSFFPSKNLGCYGDGGALFTDNDALAERIRMIANHGSTKKYHHTMIGVNSRLDTVQAAVLNVKLKYLDSFNAARREAADYYDKGFADEEKIQTPYRHPSCKHVFHQYTLVLQGIDNVLMQKYLAEHDIPSMIYYPHPMHLQKAFEPFIDNKQEFPISEQLAASVLSLPMHTELSREEQDYITATLIAYIHGN